MEVFNLLKSQNQNNMTQRLNSIIKDKEQNNSIQNQNEQNNYLSKKNNLYKSTKNSNNYINLDSNKKYKRNCPNNLNPNNTVPMNKANRTYTSFPKISQDMSGLKIYNNYFDPKDMSILEKTSSIPKYGFQTAKVAAYINKPKKVLLTSPDNIPPNAKIRKKNNIKNKYLGNQSEKINKIRKMENFYNNNIFDLQHHLKSNEEEIIKSFKNIK